MGKTKPNSGLPLLVKWYIHRLKQKQQKTKKILMDNPKSYWTVTTTHGCFNFTYILTK